MVSVCVLLVVWLLVVTVVAVARTEECSVVASCAAHAASHGERTSLRVCSREHA